MIPINFADCMSFPIDGATQHCLVSYVNPDPSIYDPKAFPALTNYTFGSFMPNAVCEVIVPQATTTNTSVNITITVPVGSTLTDLMGTVLVYLKQGILCHIHLTSRTRSFYTPWSYPTSNYFPISFFRILWCSLWKIISCCFIRIL